MPRTEAVIVDAVRTPSGRGKPVGALSGVHPADLLAGVLAELVNRTGLDPVLVDDVIGGCVTPSGEQAANITRTAVLSSGLPESVPAVTIDRQCGSSQQAAAFAAQGVIAGAYDIVIACGVESMSRVPMGSNAGGASPSGELLSARYPDGLVNQGVAAELVASRWGLSRAELDDFAATSHQRAAEAAAAGAFEGELMPVPTPGSGSVSADETIRPGTTVERLARLAPSFRTDALASRFPQLEWQITPGNSSPLTDSASAVLIMGREAAERLGMTPRAVPLLRGRGQRSAPHADGHRAGHTQAARPQRSGAGRGRRLRGQ
jgi:acetyl-CoA acyltransferase